MKIERFEDLLMRKDARILTQEIYLMTKEDLLSKDFGLRDQLQRASVSVMTNIAEGFEKHSNKDFLKFLYIAKGSCGEVRSLLYVVGDVGYLELSKIENIQEQAIKTSKLISSFMKHLK